MTRGHASTPQLLANWAVGTPREVWESLLEQPRGSETLVAALHRGGIPLRLAEALCREVGADGASKVTQLRKAVRARLLEAVTQYPLDCTGHEGYAKVWPRWLACSNGLASIAWL